MVITETKKIAKSANHNRALQLSESTSFPFISEVIYSVAENLKHLFNGIQ